MICTHIDSHLALISSKGPNPVQIQIKLHLWGFVTKNVKIRKKYCTDDLHIALCTSVPNPWFNVYYRLKRNKPQMLTLKKAFGKNPWIGLVGRPGSGMRPGSHRWQGTARSVLSALEIKKTRFGIFREINIDVSHMGEKLSSKLSAI